MAIYNEHMKTMGSLQGLVSLQPTISVAYERADHIQLHLREHPPYRVSTGQRAAQPSVPETIAPVLLQGVEAAHTCQYHNCGTEIYGGSVDQWPKSGVSYMGEKTCNNDRPSLHTEESAGEYLNPFFSTYPSKQRISSPTTPGSRGSSPPTCAQAPPSPWGCKAAQPCRPCSG